jgi:DNA-binding NarL/FixJ family response regulator
MAERDRRVGIDARITPREAEVWAAIARGLANPEITETLVMSIETLRSHLKGIYRKLGAHDRAQAVAMAYEWGLVRPGSASPDGSGKHAVPIPSVRG